MAASVDTLKPWDVSSCSGGNRSHLLCTLSAKVRNEILAMEMESLFKTKRRMDAWTRMDLYSKTYKTTNKVRQSRCMQSESDC